MVVWIPGILDWLNLVGIDLLQKDVALLLEVWLVTTGVITLMRLIQDYLAPVKASGIDFPITLRVVFDLDVVRQQHVRILDVRYFDDDELEDDDTGDASYNKSHAEKIEGRPKTINTWWPKKKETESSGVDEDEDEDEDGFDQPEAEAESDEEVPQLTEETSEASDLPSVEHSKDSTATALDMNDPYFARDPIDADAYLAAVAERHIPGTGSVWSNVLLTGYVAVILMAGSALTYLHLFTEDGLAIGPFAKEGVALKGTPAPLGAKLYYWDYAQVVLRVDPASIRGNFKFTGALAGVFEQEYTVGCLTEKKGKPTLLEWTTTAAKAGDRSAVGMDNHPLLGEALLINRADAGWTGKSKNKGSLSSRERLAMNNVAQRAHFIERRFGKGKKSIGDEWTSNDPMFSHAGWLEQEQTTSTYVYKGTTNYQGRVCATIEQKISFTGYMNGLLEGQPGTTIPVSFMGLNKIMYDLKDHYILEEQLNGMLVAELQFREGPYAGSSVRMNGPFYYASVAGQTQVRKITVPQFPVNPGIITPNIEEIDDSIDDSMDGEIVETSDGHDSSEDTPHTREDYVVVAMVQTESGANLRMRSGPSERAEIVGRVPSNTLVQVLQEFEDEEPVQGEYGKWYKIYHDNTSGWVWGKYLIFN